MPELVDHEVPDPEVTVADDARSLERQALAAPGEAELDRRVRLVDRVELRVEPLPEIAAREEGKGRRGDRMDLGELLRHLQIEPGRRAP